MCPDWCALDSALGDGPAEPDELASVRVAALGGLGPVQEAARSEVAMAAADVAEAHLDLYAELHAAS